MKHVHTFSSFSVLLARCACEFHAEYFEDGDVCHFITESEESGVEVCRTEQGGDPN